MQRRGVVRVNTHGSPSLVEEFLFLWIDLLAHDRCSFVVGQVRVRRPRYAIARLPCSQTEVDVVEIPREINVETVEFIECARSDEHRRCRHRREVPRRQGRSKIAREGPRMGNVRVGGARREQDYPGVLNSTVGVCQQRPYNTHARVIRHLEQPQDWLIAVHGRVVVQKEEELSS